MISPYNPIFTLICIFVAIFTTYCIGYFHKQVFVVNRFSTIDGLRGYLAFFVFLHHASVWYGVLHEGRWVVPPSNLYTHLGESSVVLFFMITGFLFFSKLIDAQSKGIDWARLYISRIFRLTPLYVFVVCCVLLIIYIHSNGVQKQPTDKLISEVANWLCFSILGLENINEFNIGFEHIYGKDTSIIIAGVTWSLKYEWFFYLCLPLIALVMGVKTQKKYIVLAIISVVSLCLIDIQVYLMLPFLSGILAAYIVRIESFRVFSRGFRASILIILFISISVITFHSGYKKLSVLLFTLVFFLIVGGNSLFGLLTNSISYRLGEVAYSIYLLHGIALFITMIFVVGRTHAQELSAIGYWLIIVGLTPLLIIGSFLTYNYIERPGMSCTNKILGILRR